MLISESVYAVDVLVLISMHEINIASPSGSNVTWLLPRGNRDSIINFSNIGFEIRFDSKFKICMTLGVCVCVCVCMCVCVCVFMMQSTYLLMVISAMTNHFITNK